MVVKYKVNTHSVDKQSCPGSTLSQTVVKEYVLKFNGHRNFLTFITKSTPTPC